MPGTIEGKATSRRCRVKTVLIAAMENSVAKYAISLSNRADDRDCSAHLFGVSFNFTISDVGVPQPH